MDNIYGQVLFDFNANFADELSVKSGELIQILYNIDSDWAYAKTLMTQNDSGGIIPVNHFKTFKLPNYLLESNQNEQLRLFLATDDFGEENGDLYFVKNELLVAQSQIDNNWFFGNYLNDLQKKGIFPTSHVTQVYYLPQQARTTSNGSSKPRKARAIHLFDNDSSNSNYSYLKFQPGDYLLILDSLDDNWYHGENLNGEKGLIPVKYVEFINDGEQILCLNRTQQAYKHAQIPEIKILEDKPKLVLPQMNSAKFCKVNFDFQPESEPELGCLSGEYLKILRINANKSEWVEVENIYGKKGMVPLSFVTLIYESDSSLEGLFENKPKMRNKSISGLFNLTTDNLWKSNKNVKSFDSFDSEFLQKRDHDPPETRAKSIRENISIFQQKINHSTKENQMIEQQRNRLSTRTYKPSEFKPPKSPVNQRSSFSVYRSPPDPPVKEHKLKPPLPPKPSKSINTRPIIFNNELLTQIKDLESMIIEKQLNNPSASTSSIETNNLDKEEYDENSSQNIESLRTNLSNMKNLFVESAQNRQLAMAQIKPMTNGESTESLYENLVKEVDLDEKLKRKLHERKMTIKELFQTEKDFANELNLCYDAFVTNCENIPSGFNRNALFDELKPVIKFSQKLVTLLEQELEKNDDSLIKIGACLIQVSQEIRDVYAPYLQNHPNVNQLIKNYDSNVEISNFIKSRIDLFRDQIKVLNLQSILIKPVQRIFKYPLFIKRIQENTDSNHIDHQNLEKAGELYTKILEFINEYKRRKDLINKYLQPIQADPADMTISDFLKKISFKSIAKKTTRITAHLSTVLGLFDRKIVDQDFLRLDASFKILEKTSRRFFSDLEEYLSSLKDLLKNEKLMFNHLLYIFEDEFHTFIIFETSSHKRFSEQFQLYSDSVKKQILLPLVSLLNYFSGPLRLINKRNDKLVDYEAILSDFEMRSNNSNSSSNNSTLRELEIRLDQAKKDYKALNDQLVEDLPKLNKASMKILVNLIKKFLNFTHEFYAKVKQDVCQEIQKAHFQITSNSSVPKLNITFQRNGSLFYSLNNNSLDQNEKKTNQTDEHVWQLKTKYSPESLFKVFKEYQPDEKMCQLSQQINDIVGLIKPYDPAGQRHIWLVDNGSQRGFIPSEVLEKYIDTNEPQIVGKTQSDLISFEDDYDLMSSKSEVSYSADNTSHTESEKIENLFKLDAKSDKYCMAMFDFKAIKENMIDLVEGKLYKLKEECDSSGNTEWWLIEDNNENTGYVPANYVQLLD